MVYGEELKQMTEEEFNGIYRNDNLLSKVAHAHECLTSNHQHSHFKAFGAYPVSYKVTKEQINKAQEFFKQRKKELIKSHVESGDLVFIGMGSDYKNPLKGGIRNHRIRTRFYNDAGQVCFIEFGKDCNDPKNPRLRIDHAVLNYTEMNQREEMNKGKRPQEKTNFKDLERKTPSLKYTQENVLKVVNKYFGCSYERFVLIDCVLNCNDFINKARLGQ